MNKKHFVRFLSMSFFLCLWLFIFWQILTTPLFGFNLQNYEFWIKIISSISAAQYAIIIFAIICWSLLFYANKNKIENIEKEEEKEWVAEEKRKKEFEENFPKINKIPIVWNILKWIYGEGKYYSLGMIGIITLGFVYKFFLINIIWNPYHDEWFHILQLHSLQRGDLIPIFESWRIELRWLFFNYVSYLIFLISNNELFSIRVASNIFSALSLFLVYCILKNIFNKKIILIILIIISLNPYFIAFSILGRFYMEWIFWMLLFIYLFILKNNNNLFLKIVVSFFGFLSFFFNIILLAVLWLKELLNKKYKDFIKTFLLTLLIIWFWQLILNNIASIDGIIKNEWSWSFNISFNINENQINHYIKSIWSYVFIFLMWVIWIMRYNKTHRNFIIYLILIIIWFLILALFTTDWYNIRYILNLYLILIVLWIWWISYFFSILYKISNNLFIIIFNWIIITCIIFAFPIYSSLNSKDLYISNSFFLKWYLTWDIESPQSILLSSASINNKNLVNFINNECTNSSCILITSDIYNTTSMFYNSTNIKLYTINKFLFEKWWYVYQDLKWNYRCIYSNQEHIFPTVENIKNIEEKNKWKKIFFLSRVWRLYDHNRWEISDHFIKNYDLINETKEVYVWNYGNNSYEKYMLFQLKR